MANINFFALGGQDENGKNSFVLEINNDIFLLNSGIKIPINNWNGIDAIICDYKYLEKNKKRVKGVFITHAHDDAFAALPWLIMDIQDLTIYATSFTTKIIENRISKYNIGHKNYKIIEIHNELLINGIKIKSFELSNSIAGSCGYNFQTPDGDILFMTNFTLGDLSPYGKTDLNTIKKQSNNILALIIDSKNAHLHGKSFEKVSIKSMVIKKIETTKKNERIIVVAYDEEMYTIQEILELAAQYERPVALYGRAYDYLYKTLLTMTNKIPKIKLVDFKMSNKIKNAIILVTGTWSRLYKRLVRIAHNKDVFLKFKPNDSIIMIAPPVNGLEVEGSQALDEVAKITMNITNITNNDYYRIRPTGDDIEEVVKFFKPKYFIPIGSLYRYLILASKHAIKAGITQDKNIILQNGKICWIKDGKLVSQKNKIKDFGDVIIDGFGVGDISYSVIRERQKLGAGGLISISLRIIKKTKKIIGDINLELIGVATKNELEELKKILNSIIIKKIDEAEEWNYQQIKNTIRKRIQRVFFKLVNKEPLVVINFFEV